MKRVDKNMRVLIPKEIRDRFDIHEGTYIYFQKLEDTTKGLAFLRVYNEKNIPAALARHELELYIDSYNESDLFLRKYLITQTMSDWYDDYEGNALKNKRSLLESIELFKGKKFVYIYEEDAISEKTVKCVFCNKYFNSEWWDMFSAPMCSIISATSELDSDTYIICKDCGADILSGKLDE